MKVYAVLVQGQCYYDRPELDALFSNLADAEAYAEEQRKLVDEDDPDELVYSKVKVSEWQVRESYWKANL